MVLLQTTHGHTSRVGLYCADGWVPYPRAQSSSPLEVYHQHCCVCSHGVHGAHVPLPEAPQKMLSFFLPLYRLYTSLKVLKFAKTWNGINQDKPHLWEFCAANCGLEYLETTEQCGWSMLEDVRRWFRTSCWTSPNNTSRDMMWGTESFGPRRRSGAAPAPRAAPPPRRSRWSANASTRNGSNGSNGSNGTKHGISASLGNMQKWRESKIIISETYKIWQYCNSWWYRLNILEKCWEMLKRANDRERTYTFIFSQVLLILNMMPQRILMGFDPDLALALVHISPFIPYFTCIDLHIQDVKRLLTTEASFSAIPVLAALKFQNDVPWVRAWSLRKRARL